MESVGRLAGGVAHDFNNLLTAILGYAELEMESSETLAPQVQNSFRQIHKAAERARDLTNQLLTFGRKQMLDIRTLDLNAGIGNDDQDLPATSDGGGCDEEPCSGAGNDAYPGRRDYSHCRR
jgi:signal transduction histidine kinase